LEVILPGATTGAAAEKMARTPRVMAIAERILGEGLFPCGKNYGLLVGVRTFAAGVLVQKYFFLEICGHNRLLSLVLGLVSPTMS